jgi:hypothetical protein
MACVMANPQYYRNLRNIVSIQCSPVRVVILLWVPQHDDAHARANVTPPSFYEGPDSIESIQSRINWKVSGRNRS